MNLQNQIVYIYLSTGTRKTLQTVKQGVDKTIKQNPMLTTISKQMGKQPNNTKDEFLGVLFAAFVKSNRSPNGRSKGVQYWIQSILFHTLYGVKTPFNCKLRPKICNKIFETCRRCNFSRRIRFVVDRS